MSDEINQLQAECEQYKQVIQEMQKEIAAYKTKFHFLERQGYEFRSIVSCFNYLELLEKTLLTQEQSEYLEIMFKAKGVLLTLVNDFIDFVKIETNKFELSSECFKFHKHVKPVFQMAQERATRMGITLTYDIDSKVPNKMVGDHFVILKILSSLIDNAIDSTIKEISVSITIEEIKKLANHSLYVMCFSVTDIGECIAPNILKDIQEFFAQTGVTTVPYEYNKIDSRQFSWEFTMIKWLGDLIEGTLWVESYPASNMTTFSFKFQIQGIIEK